MKKSTLAILITLIAIVVAVLVLLPQPTEAPTPATAEPVIETESPEITGVGTLAALQGSDERLECTIQYRSAPEADEIEGSYFVDGAKVRGDFVIEDQNLGQIVSSYIVNDDQVYVWSLIDGQSYGIQTTVGTRSSVDELPVPEDVPVRYSCEPWLEYDSSIFNPPSDVLFRDPLDLQAEFGTIYEEEAF